ncbi:MAG: 16S rRNA (guanine(527)-N(7))-methyltransferase RsmG [Beijerinckiaceae bacterium]
MILSAATLPDVSRETRARLDVIVAQLRKWQPRINLVAPSTMAAIEDRHVADSLQLIELAPDARSWIDLGSGGGFPGLVVGAVLAGRQDGRVWLLESNAKKCAFLRETARLAELPVEVICDRIEHRLPGLGARFDVVSARALAPLDKLLDLAEPVLATGAIGLFPKGEDVDDEINAALRAWHMEHDLIQSLTERKARIVRVRSAVRRSA